MSRAPPETLSLARCETFLMDSLEVSMCWEFRNGGGEGSAGTAAPARRFRTVPAPPDYDARGIRSAVPAGGHHRDQRAAQPGAFC